MDSREKNLLNILERSPIVTVLWQNKENWPVELISNNVSQLLGYTAEEFMNQTISYIDIIHNDDLSLLSKEVEENSKNEINSFMHAPYRIKTKNGKTKWIKDQTYIRRDNNGKITHYEGIIQDITHLKITERNLSKYFHAVEASPAAITITDSEGIIEYVNSKFTQVTGYTKEDSFGKNMNIVKSGVQRKDFYIDLWKTLRQGKEWSGIFCNKKKNGEIFWEKASISSIKDSNNNIIQYIGLKEDITKEKEHEEIEKEQIEQKLKYRSELIKLLQITPSDFMTGIKMTTEIISKTLIIERVSIWKITDNKDSLECLDLYTNNSHIQTEKIFRSQYPTYFMELDNKKMIITSNVEKSKFKQEFIKEKEKVSESKSIMDIPIIIAGKLSGVVSLENRQEIKNWTREEEEFISNVGLVISTLFETFERINTEKKLVLAVEEAKRANRVKSDFLANMSHEIRTPMNSILGFSQILLSRIKNEEEREFIESIHSSGKHLLSLINDILDLSKVEAGKTDIIYKKCNFPELIENIENMFQHKLSGTDTKLYINTDSYLPQYLMLDNERLTQVLVNLVGNAVKFTKKGSIKITSYSKYTVNDKNNITLIIDIDDTGIGIPKKEWENVFSPFDQTREGAKSEYSGTGLGLAISRKLINLMNGNIIIIDKTGPGTLFRITLNNINIVQTPKEKQNRQIFEQKHDKPKTNEGFIAVENASTIEVSNIPELVEVLNGISLKTCNSLIKKLSMQKAKIFAKDITLLGNKYGLLVLIDWSKKLSKAVISFKKDDIIEILISFTDLVKKIENFQYREEE